MGAAFKSRICPWIPPLCFLTYHIVNKSLLKSPPPLTSLHYSYGPFPLKLWVKITLPVLHCLCQVFDLSNENIMNTSPNFWVCPKVYSERSKWFYFILIINDQLASPSQWHILQKSNHWYMHEEFGGMSYHPWISNQNKYCQFIPI